MSHAHGDIILHDDGEGVHYDDEGMMIPDINAKSMNEAKKKGMWDYIHARRRAKKPRLKRGQKGYPKTLNIAKKSK